jgi:tetratricopeptide (TPR) repeat protein
MSLSGKLKTMQLGDILQWCGQNRKTGTLRLARGPIEKHLFFRDGRLFSSTSNSPRETLGQFLIRSGKITEEQLFRALFQQDSEHQPLGQILIGEQLLTAGELEELLQLKTEETIYDCFLWDDGEFSFQEGQLPERIPVSLPLELTGVILEGARRSDEWTRIHEVFRSRLTTFARTPGPPVQHSDEDRRILDLVDRNKNLAEIALEMHAVEFYVASRLLEFHESGQVRVERIVEEPPFERRVEELHALLRQGVILYNAARHAEALANFRQALEIDSHNKYARAFVLKLERVLRDQEAVRLIALDAVPKVKVSLEDLATVELDPQEAFVLSRVNGEWDVASILKICPLDEEETLLIFKRFADEDLVEMGPPAKN